jgi:hypothetical protein
MKQRWVVPFLLCAVVFANAACTAGTSSYTA